MFCLCIIIQESVQTTSSLVIMESVSVNGIVAVTEMNVVMVQMNSSVVSLLSLSPLSKYCSHLSYGLMANYSSCAVVISLSLSFPFPMNRIINNCSYNMDQVSKIRLVLIVVILLTM